MIKAGFPTIVLDSLLYIRAWSSYNRVFSDFTSVASTLGFHHVLWVVVSLAGSSARKGNGEEDLRWWLKMIWIETAGMCGSPAYKRMLSELLLIPQFQDGWLSLVNAGEDTQPMYGLGGLASTAGEFRMFRTQVFLPPTYHVCQFVPFDERANQTIRSLLDAERPTAEFASIVHWSQTAHESASVGRRTYAGESTGLNVSKSNETPVLEKRLNASVILFSKERDCIPCVEAKEFLEANGVSYVEKDVTVRDNLVQLVKQFRLISVPVLVVNDTAVSGFNREEYEKLLGLSGSRE